MIELKTIERIRKLLALANDGGATEAEAELALARAHQIMSENNLTMATIAASGQASSDARLKERIKGQAMYRYQVRIMEALCATSYCFVSVVFGSAGKRADKHYRSGHRAKSYQIIGSEGNVASVQIMFEYLMQTMNRLVMTEINNDHRQRMSRYAMSFCDGCAERLADRIQKRHQNYLAEQKREANKKAAATKHPAAASTGTDLVVVMEDYEQNEKDLNEDMLWGHPAGTTGAKRKLREARRAEAKAAGLDWDEEWYYVHYPEMTIEQAKARHAEVKSQRQKLIADETPAKKAKREAKEQAANERFRRSYQRQQNRELDKRDWSGYVKGKKVGDSIGLDAQVKSNESNEPTRRIK